MTALPHTKTAPPLRTSILRRMRTQAVILTAFVIVVLTSLSFVVSRMMIENAVFSQLSSIASVSDAALENTLQAHRERASLLTSSAEIQGILQERRPASTLASFFVDLRQWQPSLVGMELYAADGDRVASGGSAIGIQRGLQKATARPVVTPEGWMSYDVYVPVQADGKLLGMLAMRYDARTALQPLLSVVPSLGKSAEAVLVYREGRDIQIVHPSQHERDSYLLSMEGSFDGLESAPLFRSLNAQEGMAHADDYKGIDSMIAYRYLPVLGWGLLIQVSRQEALQDVHRLAIAHMAIGLLLLIFASALASVLANQLTAPLRMLTMRVAELKPGHWAIDRSVQSGDEVEMLEGVIVDMASRLKHAYEEQEGVIEERTEELHEQYVLDRAIVDNIGYGVVTIDQTGTVISANPAASQFIGQTAQVMAGKKAEDVLQICGHRGNPLTGVHPVRECLQTQKPVRSPVNGHFNIRRSDETLLPVMYAISPLVTDGHAFGAIIVFQDVSEERRLDYLKSEFITLASHQLRTPLSAIRWYIELLGEDESHLSTEQRDYLHEMQTSIIRMAALLTSLLHAARLEGDNLEPDIQEVDVIKVLQELHDDCLAMAHESGLSCALTVPQAPLSIHTDPTLLRVVLQNLMTNAVKYSKNSKSVITLELADRGESITISVRDQGMGIPAEEQPRVFQKFFRAKNVRKQDTDGNGLGLYITRSIVERLGGTIRFTSEENKGSTFTITLPKNVPAQNAGAPQR